MGFEGQLYRWVCDGCGAEVLSTSQDEAQAVLDDSDLASKGWRREVGLEECGYGEMKGSESLKTLAVFCPECVAKIEAAFKLAEKALQGVVDQFVSSFPENMTIGPVRDVVDRRASFIAGRFARDAFDALSRREAVKHQMDQVRKDRVKS